MTPERAKQKTDKTMKKIISIIIVASMALSGAICANAQMAKNTKSQITSLAKEFKGKAEFESMELGSFMMSIAKMAVKLDSDKDDAAMAIKAMDKIDGMTVIDLEDCSKSIREQFTSRFESIVGGADKALMEVKDEEDTVRFYGSPSADGRTIRDLIIYNVNDCEIVCIWGSISKEGMEDLNR